jgi:hypothetical protein
MSEKISKEEIEEMKKMCNDLDLFAEIILDDPYHYAIILKGYYELLIKENEENKRSVLDIIDLHAVENAADINELTGSVYMSDDCLQSEEDRFYFYCGPEKSFHGLCSHITINDYLESLCAILEYDIRVDEGTNWHSIGVKSTTDGPERYKIIKEAIEQEGIKVYNQNKDE